MRWGPLVWTRVRRGYTGLDQGEEGGDTGLDQGEQGGHWFDLGYGSGLGSRLWVYSSTHSSKTRMREEGVW